MDFYYEKVLIFMANSIVFSNFPSTMRKQGQISCSTNQRLCLHFRSQLIIMQETRNLHQGELENIAVFSGFRDIQF